MKKNDDMKSITYDSSFGPIFGKEDIYISYKCNKEDSCYIYNDGTRGYECHPKYKSSLFVKTNGPGKKNEFAVLDYEVYNIDYKNKYTIDHVCEYPDIIWEYLQTHKISEEILKQFNYDDRKLLKDMNAIQAPEWELVKLAHKMLKTPSKYLPKSHIVDQKYDSYLKEWTGNCRMKQIYKAARISFLAFFYRIFRGFFDSKRPTLFIIKTTNGDILGGYTTRLWADKSIYLIL